jgi:hypothetical protein
MTIAKDFASKFAVAFVAVAMLFTLVAPAVNAAETVEDLQKTIADLLAQVAELEGKTADADSSASCEAIAAPLTMGSTGANVTALQNRLIADGEAIAAGATGYFGAQTKAALASWQGKNSVSPAIGYYGPLTAAAMAADCTPADEDDEDDSSSDELQGEGTLDVFEIDDASDTDVQEGAEDAEIAELTLEATDGDVELSRMDIALTTGGSEDPWDVFETITLWVDGDMIAEVTADDEDEYLDDVAGTLRFSDIGLVLMEDEEVDVVVAATVQGAVDGTLPAAWSLGVEEVRYFDADGVADDDSTTGDIGSTVSADFNVVVEGDGEELKFSIGDNSPEATDIIVDDTSKTNGVTILEYTIEAQEGDIDLNNLVVRVDTSASTTAVVDDIMVVIDGAEFDAEALVATNKGTISATESRYVNNDVTNDSVWYAFDIDGDVTIDMDEEVTVEVIADLKSQSGNYSNGATILAEVTSVERGATDAEGADNVTTFSGTAVGETHTMVAEGIVVPVDGFTATVDTLGQNDTIGEYTLEFEVTAIEGDFYITDNAATSTGVVDGVRYTIDPAASGSATAVLESTGDEDTSGVFTVQEGATETFTLTVTYDPAAAGSFRVQLEEVWYSSNVNGTTGALQYTPAPATDFRSASKAINN